MTSTNSKKSPNKSPRGVTLVELMVVMAVLSIVLGLIYSIFISQMQSSIWRDELAERKQNLDGAMNLMISEFIKADGVIETADTCETNIRVRMKNTVGGFDTLQYIRDDAENTLLRVYNGDPRVVAENITGLEFRCFNQSGDEMHPDDPDTFKVADIRRVTMALTGETKMKSPVTNEKTKATITGSIRLRNMPTYAGSGCGVLYFSLNPTNVAFCDPPGQTSNISVRVCDLEGRAMDATGENAVRIYPKGGLPVDIEGSNITIDDDGVAIMEINSPADTACMDIAASTATISADLEIPENAARLTPGTGVELIAFWKPPGCSYEVSTSRSLKVEAGDPFKFKGGDNGLDIFVDNVSTTVLNACQSAETAELRATVVDNCGNKLHVDTVDFAVLPVANDQRGYIGPVTEKNGVYNAIYTAGTLANAGGVDVRVYSPDIESTPGGTPTATNTITLRPHTPNSLVRRDPSGGSLNVENCINNYAGFKFDVLDLCNNRIIANQTSYLTASSTDIWTDLHGGGLGNIVKNADNSYSVIYNTSSTHCGPAESAKVYIDHSEIPDDPDLMWDLLLTQCDVPGLSLVVDPPLNLSQGCGDASKKVTATVLIESADPKRNCVPAPANTQVKVEFELRNVADSGPGADWGISDGSHPNGRFLIPPALTPSTSAATTVSAYSPTPAITNIIAWDAKSGDEIWLRARAVIPSFTNGSLPDFRIPAGGVWKEYPNPIQILNGDSSALDLLDTSWVAPAHFYHVPKLVPSPETGFIYAQVMDCDENEHPDSQDFIKVNVGSDNAGFTNSIEFFLEEVDPTKPGITPAANTGYFRAKVPMKRVAEAATLHVDKGAEITVDYTDDDDPSDYDVNTINLTGCRELLLVDKDGMPRTSVTPSLVNGSGEFTIVEGVSTFSLRANAPTSVGGGITNSTMIDLPQGSPLLAQVCSRAESDPPNTVYLIEDGDTGVFIINATSTGVPHPEGFMFVGENIGNAPVVTGDEDLGVWIQRSPDLINAVVPATASPCNLNDQDVVNYGCSIQLPVEDIDKPVFLTFTPPAGTVNSPDNANFDIYVEDNFGIINSVMLWMCVNSASCPSGAFVVAKEIPNASTFNQTLTFDTSEYANGYYQFFATATDTEGNTGTSNTETKYVGNYCRITDAPLPGGNAGLKLQRANDGKITVSGVLNLNDKGTNGTVDLTLTDGNGNPQMPSVSADATGNFSWTSSSAMVASVGVIATGTHQTCTTGLVNAAEYCDINVSSKKFDYNTGAIELSWEYILSGSGYSGPADILFVNAAETTGSPPETKYEEIPNVASVTDWTSWPTQFGMTNVTVEVGGKYGECYVAAPSFILNAPTCYINIYNPHPNDDGSVTVGWRFFLDGNLQGATMKGFANSNGLTDYVEVYAPAGDYEWTTTTQFPPPNDIAVDLYGDYGVCNASDSVLISPLTCGLTVNDVHINDDGTVFADWTYLMNAATHEAEAMTVIINSTGGFELPYTKTFTGVSNGMSTWTSTQAFANNVDVYMYGLYGSCNATASQPLDAPTCDITGVTSSYNSDGTLNFDWQYTMNNSPHAADTMSIVTKGVSDPDDGATFSGVPLPGTQSWTTGVPYTNTVSVDLTGQFGVCNAGTTLNPSYLSPTCNIEITSGPTYDINTGKVTVNWDFLLNNSVYNANTLTAFANSGMAGQYEEKPYINHIGPYSWITNTAFTDDVALEFRGQYSDSCTFTNSSISVPVPACEVEFLGAPSYNVLDGKVTTVWQFLIDNAVSTAEVLNASAYDWPSGGSTLEDVNPVASGVSNTTWNTNTTSWSSDVTVDIGGNKGVCVAPMLSDTAHVQTCLANITSAPIYNVMDGSVTVGWEYRLDGSPQNATLSASASDLDGNFDSTTVGPLSNYSWMTDIANAVFTNDVTVDVRGQYGVCNATDTATVTVPQCKLDVTAGSNTNGTVTVNWEFWRGAGLQNADSVSITLKSDSDPTDGTTFSGVDSATWTSGVIFTNTVTVTVDGNYGVCAAPTFIDDTVAPWPTSCDIAFINVPSYDIINGTIDMDWEFRLDGVPYVANTMTANADSGIGETDTDTFTEQKVFSWTASPPTGFTNDVTITLTGQYSDTCKVISTSTVDVPACSVIINGSSYNFSDGSVTTDWTFFIDNAASTADFLNAVASDGISTDSKSFANATITSWQTIPFNDDVTVYVGGNKGVCRAPAESVTVQKPTCDVEFNGAPTYDINTGEVTANWRFLIDNAVDYAEVLNAAATDAPFGTTTEEKDPAANNAQNTSWTTGTTDWSGDVTVYIGGYNGVCVAPALSNTVHVPACSVAITNAVYNLETDGSVTTDWTFFMDNSPAPAQVLNAAATDGSTTEEKNPAANNAQNASWITTKTMWPNNVTVYAGGNYGVCVAPAVSNTVQVSTCLANITSATYDVSTGQVTVDWKYTLDSDPHDATLDASASDLDGNTDNSFAPVVANNTQWITTTAFTNDVTVDVSGKYGVCNATDTTIVDVPQCSINIFNKVANADGTVTVDWEFRRGTGLQIANSVSLIANSPTEPAYVGATYTTDDDGIYSWTSGVIFTNDVSVKIDGNYGVCLATNSTTVTHEPTSCGIVVTNAVSHDEGNLTVEWQFKLNDTLYNADTMTADADSGIGGETETVTYNDQNTFSWITGMAFSNDVTVELTGQYSTVCTAYNSVTVSPPSCEISNATASVNDEGKVEVYWEYFMNTEQHIADTLIANTTSPLDTTTVPNASTASWTSNVQYANDVEVVLYGEYSKCKASQTLTVSPPECWIDFMPTSENPDGTVKFTWQYMMNGSVHNATSMSIATDSDSDPADGEAFGAVTAADQPKSWTTSIPYTNVVNATVTGEYEVCMATNSTSFTPSKPECNVLITSGPTYDIYNGTIYTEWNFLLNDSIYDANTLGAFANSGTGQTDSFSATNVNSASWTAASPPTGFTNDVALTFSGSYSNSCAFSNKVDVHVPECTINIYGATADPASGRVTVNWTFLMDGNPQIANSVSIATDSGSDPADGEAYSDSSGDSWTSDVIYTSDISVTMDGNFGVCMATNSTTITRKSPECNVKITNGPSYDIDSGNVSVDWNFVLNNVPYIANTLDANADSGTGQTDTFSATNVNGASWTAAWPLTGFTNDVALEFSGSYSNSCSFTNSSISVDVPSCEVNIDSSSYNFSDGSVTTKWTFLMDTFANAADVLNAVASDGVEPDETMVPPATNTNSTSWTTGTTNWSNDVTVYVGGNDGKCVAPAQSATVTIPECTVEFVGVPSYNVLDGKVTANWRFLIDGSVNTAEVLNAAATDGSTTEEKNPAANNAQNALWTTGTADWAGDVTVYAGGYNGVCVAPAVSNTVHVPTCGAVIDSTLYNVDTGQVMTVWSYYLDGNPQPATLNASASDLDGNSDNLPSPVSGQSTSWTSNIAKPFTNDVTVEVSGEYGVCMATNSTVVDVPQCDLNVNATADPSSGKVTVDWTFLMDGMANAADNVSITLGSASDPTDSTTTSGESGTWTSDVIYTNNISVTVEGNHGVCNAPTYTDTIPPKLPVECNIEVTSGPTYDIDTGEVSVKWNFLLNDSVYNANTLTAFANSGTGETDTFSATNVNGASWTASPLSGAFTNDVALEFGGSYSNTCSFTNSSISVHVPECTVEFINNSPTYELSDGSVTAEWQFLIDGVVNTADVLNAVAYNGSDPDDSKSVAGFSSTIWNTTTKPWSSDVTVVIGGNDGKCKAPAVSDVAKKPECWVEALNPLAISNGAANMDLEFMVDGSPHFASILNAAADDGYTSYKAEFTDVAAGDQPLSWTSGVPFTNDISVDISAEYGVCQVTNTTTIGVTPLPGDCYVNVTSAIYNDTDGSVNVEWQFELFGNVYPAETMVANATNPLRLPTEDTGDTAIADPEGDGIYSWDTSTIPAVFSNDVTVRIEGTYGACTNAVSVPITRTDICNAIGGFYSDSAYSTPATYQKAPLVSPSTVTKLYVEVKDCDENEDRYAKDSINVTMNSDNGWDDPWVTPYDKVNTILVETGPNTGVFQNAVTTTRNAGLVDTLDVEASSFINGTYTDDDDPADSITGEIPVEGARRIIGTDALGNEIFLGDFITVDGYPYDPAYPDGDSAFHIELNMPYLAGNGIQNTVTVRTLSCDFSTLVDSHIVTLKESSDDGILTIDSSTHSTDYVYVGSDDAIAPAPGSPADTAVGLRVPSNPSMNPYPAIVVYPDVGATCDPWSTPGYLNFGRDWWGEAAVCESSIALNGSEDGILEWPCFSRHRTDSGFYDDYYAKYYNFSISADTGVEIDVVSPGPMVWPYETHVYLLDSTGSVITEAAAGSGSCFECSRIATPLVGGDYTIEVTSEWAWNSGDYTVSLTEIVPPPVVSSPASYDFESGIQGWTTEGLWHASSRYGLSRTAHYGLEESDGNPLTNPGCVSGNSCYDTGAQNSGSLTSPNQYKIISSSSLSFDYSLQTECGGGACPFDNLTVEMSTDGGITWPITLAGPLPDTGYQVFANQWFDLSPWAGKTVTIRFRFDTVDAGVNDYEGAYVDNILIKDTVTQVLPVALTNSGWYEGNTYTRSGSDNYLVGMYNSGTSTEYRNFFIFDLSGVTGTIMDATLSVDKASYSIPPIPGTETWTIFDVSTPIPMLKGAGGMAAFNDLGSGTSYGSVSIPNALTPNPVTVNLNASAVSALNAALGGDFAFGGAITTLDADPLTDEYIFGGTTSANPKRLTLEVLP